MKVITIKKGNFISLANSSPTVDLPVPETPQTIMIIETLI
jgi:hypothetical protein